MSLRFYANTSLERVRSYTISEFFNPTINQCIFDNYSNDAPDLTVAKWMKLLRQLFTRDNLIMHGDKMFRGAGNFDRGERTSKITAILDAIGEENHAACAYIEFVAGRSGRTTFGTFTPTRVRTDDNGNIYFSYDDDYREIGSWGTEAWKTELKGLASAITTRLNNIEAAHGEKKISPEAPFGTAGFCRNLAHHFCNQRYIRAATPNRHFRPTDIVEGLNSGDTQLTVSASGHNSVSVSVTERVTRANKRSLYTVMSYSASPTAILPWPIINKGETKPVLYGVELECATDYSVQAIIDATDEPFMLVKSDSSVTGRGAHRYELVTVPMSFRAHKREWAKWFSKLDYDKFDTTKNTSNGMHVHIGREHFIDDKHIQRLAWFMNNPANRDFIFALSERTQSSLDSYSPLARFDSSGSKVYNYKNVVQYVEVVRGALNLGTNKPTVEVRLFRGIVSYAAILKNLECVDAFFHFSAEANFNQLNLKGFLSWLEETPPNKYPIFKKFIYKLPNFQELVSASDLYDIIQNTTDPHQIVRIIEKKNFKVTNSHITALNRRHKKRTFILDKETGTIRLKVSDRSPLFHLDRQLQQNQLRGIQQ